MKIVCPNCGADYRMSQDKIPEDGLLIRCPSCRHSFKAFGNGTTSSVGDGDDASNRRPEEQSIAPPPPPPLDLGDDFDVSGEIEFVDEPAEFGLEIDLSEPQSSGPDIGFGLTPPPPPPPPVPLSQPDSAESVDDSLDEFDFSFGIKQPITDNPKSAGPLKDLFDDLDDLPAPKVDAGGLDLDDLPAPRAPIDPFQDLVDLPSPKSAQAPSTTPEYAGNERLLAPEHAGEPEAESAEGVPVAEPVAPSVPAPPAAAAAQKQKRGGRPVLWAAMITLVLGGGGVAAMMLLQVGPFEQEKLAQTSARSKPQPRPKPKRTKVEQGKVEKQTADNKQPVLDGTRTPVGQPEVDPKTDTVERSDDRIAEDTSTVTLAEVAGYRAQIAKLENRQDTLSAEDRAKLVLLYSLGALDYPENVQWVQAAADQAKKLDPKSAQTDIQAALLATRLVNADDKVGQDIEQAARKNKNSAVVNTLLGHVRLKSKAFEGAFKAFKRAYKADANQVSAQKHAGLLALRLGRVNEAARIMESLYKRAPGTPDVNIGLAAIESHRGQSKRAVALLTQALTLPTSRIRAQARSRAFVLRARIALAAQEKDAAMGDLQSAVRAWPENAEALALLSDEAIKSGRFDDAINQLRTLERAGAKSAQTSIKIAQCYVHMNRYDRALEILNEARTRYPKDASVLLALGETYESKRDFVEGRKAYDEAIKMQPNSGLARLRIAKLMVKEAKIDPALAYLKEATVAFPMEPLMHIGLGDLRVQIAQTVSDGYQEHFNQAEEHYRRALRIDQGSLSARRGLLTTLIANEKPKEALVEIERLKQRTDFYGVLDFEIARVNQLRKQYDKALTYFEKALKRDPNNVSIMKYTALTEYARGDNAKAEASFRKVITLEPKDVTALYHLGLIAFQGKRTERAVQMFQKVLERNKQHQRARYWKARALESLPGTRSLDAARAEYETVAKAADKNPKLKLELCDVYRRRGRLMAKNFKEWKTAESSFSRFLECQPKDAEAWLARGKIRADLGRLDDAISDFERAGRLNSKLGEAFSNNAYTRIRKRKFDLRRVQKLLQRAVAVDKTLARPHYTLCNMVKDKNKARARGHCQTYLKLAPNGDNAADARDLLRNL